MGAEDKIEYLENRISDLVKANQGLVDTALDISKQFALLAIKLDLRAREAQDLGKPGPR